MGGFPEWVGCETIVYTVHYIHGSEGTSVKVIHVRVIHLQYVHCSVRVAKRIFFRKKVIGTAIHCRF